MNRNTEVRKINAGYMHKLAEILEISESWQTLMGIIPKDLIDEESPAKYSSEDISLVKRYSEKKRENASLILLEEWGIAGRNRPRIHHLLKLLIKAQLYRAADYVAVHILKEPPPERPNVGPAAKIEIDDRLTASEQNMIVDQLNDCSINSSLIQYNQSSTNLNRNIVNNNTMSIPKIIVNSVSDDEELINSNSNNPSVVDSTFRPASSEQQVTSPPNGYDSNLIEFSNFPLDSNLIRAFEHDSENQIREFEYDSNSIEFSQSNMPEASALIPDFNELNKDTGSGIDVEPMIPQISVLLKSNSDEMVKSKFSNLSEQDSGISGQPNLNVPDMTELLHSEECNDPVPGISSVEFALPQISALLSPSSENSVEYLSSESFLENSITESIQNDLNSENAIPQIAILLNTAPNITEEQQTSSSDNNETASSNLPTSSHLNTQSIASPLPNLDLNTELPHFPYTDLMRCTLNFNENMYVPESLNYDSRKLGSGAFGTVYLGIGLVKTNVAIKKLHLNGIEPVSEDDTVTRQFVSEVEILYRYRHENLLSLLGYSCDGPTYCLIYEYISGGVLGDRIVSKSQILPWITRLKIAHGVAKAVSYLHTAYATPLIHRDIKSANILLDNKGSQIIPKLADFGLIKLLSNNTNTCTQAVGTAAYMAPEANIGDVSVKTDSFSFGVVLLELLTGLPPIDQNRDGIDIVTHVYEIIGDKSIDALLDYNDGPWIQYDINYSKQLYYIAKLCLEKKSKRPTMFDVCHQITQLLESLQD